MSSVDELREALTTGRRRLLQAIEGVTEQQFKQRPAGADGGEAWCIAEVLAHLLATEQLWSARIRAALEQDGAPVEPSDPAAHEAQARAGRHAPVPQLIHGLLAARRDIELQVERLAADAAALDRAIEHPRDGRRSIGWMLREKVIAHEAEHAAQIEALRQAIAAQASIARAEPL